MKSHSLKMLLGKPTNRNLFIPVSLLFVLIILISLSISSCNKEKTNEAAIIKENIQANQISVSTEYQNLLNSITIYGTSIRENYLKLPLADRLKFRNILAQVQSQKDPTLVKNLIKSAGLIISVDIMEQTYIIQSKALLVENNCGVEKIDKSVLISTISRDLNLIQTEKRLKSGSIQPNQVQYDPCEDICYSSFILKMLCCAILPPGFDAVCIAEELIWYSVCITDCPGN